jgi:AcrR family transcriptional regulator
MAKEVKSRAGAPPAKRAYRSERRTQQAQETRRAIREAAEKLFVANGYAATSIAAIAEEAGVAPETVYATFKNKRTLLLEIEDVAIVGDDRDVPLIEREFVESARAEPDLRRRYHMVMDSGLDAVARPAQLDRVLRNAADADPELAKLHEGRRKARYEDTRRFTDVIAAGESFRIPFDDAVDLSFALCGTEVFDILVGELGWPVEKWKSTITTMLERYALEN